MNEGTQPPNTSVDNDLIESYRTARYVVREPGLEIKIGETNQDLDDFLKKYKSGSWAFITPFNPGSEITSNAENLTRLQTLKEQTKKYTVFEGEGGGQGQKWPLEKSLLILGITLRNAKKMGKSFGQNAIVFGYVRNPAQIIILN